jgi:hypothetical protein
VYYGKLPLPEFVALFGNGVVRLPTITSIFVDMT